MTATEMAELIGKKGLLDVDMRGSKTDKFLVPVVIKDVRPSYGRIRYAVSPVNGKGEAVVDADRVTFK